MIIQKWLLPVFYPVKKAQRDIISMDYQDFLTGTSV